MFELQIHELIINTNLLLTFEFIVQTFPPDKKKSKSNHVLNA